MDRENLGCSTADFSVRSFRFRRTSVRPSVGSSTDTILRKPLRQNKALAAEIGRYRTEFCVSDSFLAAVDKLAGNSSKPAIQERRINYILSTGANWSGPIKNFKLTIDPGAADRLVSFCTGGLKATSPNGAGVHGHRFQAERRSENTVRRKVLNFCFTLVKRLARCQPPSLKYRTAAATVTLLRRASLNNLPKNSSAAPSCGCLSKPRDCEKRQRQQKLRAKRCHHFAIRSRTTSNPNLASGGWTDFVSVRYP